MAGGVGGGEGGQVGGWGAVVAGQHWSREGWWW